MIRSLFRKAVFVLVPLSCFALSAQQRDGQTDRDAVVIDYFFTARGVSPAYAERVRSGVVEGFLRRGRHRVIDARMVRELYLEEGIWMNALWGQRETAWQQDLRKKRMGSLGGRYLLVGYVSLGAELRRGFAAETVFWCISGMRWREERRRDCWEKCGCARCSGLR